MLLCGGFVFTSLVRLCIALFPFVFANRNPHIVMLTLTLSLKI